MFASIQMMHIPDGFLSLPISAVAWLLTIVGLYLAIGKAQKDIDERLIPLAGIIAAFIFAAQMINFPVAGGTSGHAIGATLAAIVLGPWLGILAMTAVVVTQAIIYQDGGLLVMGANILVMGLVPAFVGYGLYQLGSGRSRTAQLVIAGIAAWLSVVVASFIVALLLGFSGTSPFSVVIPAMLGIHVLIGLGEALITVAALNFVMQTRPQTLKQSAALGGRGWVVVGLAIPLIVVLFAPLASAFPDGLEWVAGEKGFLATAQEAPYTLLPDYTIPFLGETSISTIVAGAVGVLIVAAVMTAAARSLRKA